jgi:putative nucleotidyltransferase with HDIG domain
MDNTALLPILEKWVNETGDLPAAPVVLAKVVKLTSDLESSLDDMSQLLRTDQALMARVLKTANSPYYGRRRKATNLSEAIMVLGYSAVKALAMAGAVRGLYVSEDASEEYDRLWQHSLAVATAARKLCACNRGWDAETMFVNGLLHDIGKLVFLQKIPKQYLKMISLVKSTKVAFTSFEHKVLGFTHCDLGSHLLSHWHLPGETVRVVLNHHRSFKTSADLISRPDYIIQTADLFAIALGFELGNVQEQALEQLQPRLDMLVDDEDRQTIMDTVKEQIEYELQVFA